MEGEKTMRTKGEYRYNPRVTENHQEIKYMEDIMPNPKENIIHHSSDDGDSRKTTNCSLRTLTLRIECMFFVQNIIYPGYDDND